jgi:hypothetical protein
MIHTKFRHGGQSPGIYKTLKNITNPGSLVISFNLIRLYTGKHKIQYIMVHIFSTYNLLLRHEFGWFKVIKNVVGWSMLWVVPL